MPSKAYSCLCDLKRVICPTIHLLTMQGHHESNCLPLQRRPGLGSDSYETSFLVVETLSFRLSVSIDPLSRIMWVVRIWSLWMYADIFLSSWVMIRRSKLVHQRNQLIQIQHSTFTQIASSTCYSLPSTFYGFLHITPFAILSFELILSSVRSCRIFVLLCYRVRSLYHWSRIIQKITGVAQRESWRSIFRIYFPYVRMSQFISVEMNSFSCPGLFSSADHNLGASFTIQFLRSLNELLSQKK